MCFFRKRRKKNRNRNLKKTPKRKIARTSGGVKRHQNVSRNAR
jgi:hypothetical protein